MDLKNIAFVYVWNFLTSKRKHFLRQKWLLKSVDEVSVVLVVIVV